MVSEPDWRNSVSNLICFQPIELETQRAVRLLRRYLRGLFINCCAISNDIVFNRSEAKSQKNRQLSSCTWTIISKIALLIGPFMKFR